MSKSLVLGIKPCVGRTLHGYFTQQRFGQTIWHARFSSSLFENPAFNENENRLIEVSCFLETFSGSANRVCVMVLSKTRFIRLTDVIVFPLVTCLSLALNFLIILYYDTRWNVFQWSTVFKREKLQFTIM